MTEEKALLIRNNDLYTGFGSIGGSVIQYWQDHIVEIGDPQATWSTIDDINQRLLTHNIVLFFDHHYAFDALPAALTLGRTITNGAGAVIPYAAHLDMGLDREGLPSLRYRLRTKAFRWLVKSIRRGAASVRFLPVVREFELKAPRLRAIVQKRFGGSNTSYLKNLARLFSRQRRGWACILAPMAGIAFPGKPILHPQLYRSMEMIQARYGEPLSFYLVGAYPRLHAYHSYFAPLLAKHTFVARGPFGLPSGDYGRAHTVLTEHLVSLRQAANFVPPDYSRIENK